MNVQQSLKRAHISSLAVSILINVGLVLLLIALIQLPKATVPPDVSSVRLSADPPPETVLDPVEPIIEPPPDPVASIESTFEPIVPPTGTDDLLQDAVAPVVEPLQINPIGTQMALMEGIEQVLTPTTLKNVRTEHIRNEQIGKYDPTFLETAEPAVLKSLKWLQQVQIKSGPEKGGWRQLGEKGKANTGMTGLALLTFLAHGETMTSAEYGTTVADGLKFLLQHQDSEGVFQPAGSHTGYGHAMATYAVAEAYSLTGNVLLEEPLNRGGCAIFC